MNQVERKDQLMTQAEGKHQTLHQHSIAASGDPTAKKAREERLTKQKAISYQLLLRFPGDGLTDQAEISQQGRDWQESGFV